MAKTANGFDDNKNIVKVPTSTLSQHNDDVTKECIAEVATGFNKVYVMLNNIKGGGSITQGELDTLMSSIERIDTLFKQIDVDY